MSGSTSDLGFGGGSTSLGSSMPMPDVGALATLGDGSVWLKTGALVGSGSYTVAANLDLLKAHILNGRGTGVTWGTHRSVATDGAGVYISTDGDTTNLRRSTDGGQTWSSVAHNSGGVAINRVIRAGSLFLAVGNTATAVVVCSSPDGATWTQRLNATVSGYGADTAAAATNGSNLHAICANPNATTTGWVWTSADGLTWTQRTAVVGTNSAGACGIAVDGTRILAVAGGVGRYSADSGATWGTSAVAGPVFAFSGGFNVNTSGSSWARCTGDATVAANWTSYTAAAATNGGGFQAYTVAGAAYYFGTGGVWVSADGLIWKLRSVDVYAAIQSGATWALSANEMVLLPASAGAPYRAATSPAGTPNAVGVMPAAVTSATGSPIYVRIK